MSRSAAVDAIWETLVVRGEALNDAVVMGQRRATLASARRIHAIATEIACLSYAAILLKQERRT